MADNENYADMDSAFTLPESIDDEQLRTLYEVIVHRLRSEAAHLTMTTVQQLLIERIAYNYIVLRYNESNNGFAHSTAQKEFNSFWLSMTQEFNRQVRQSDEEFRATLLNQVAGIFASVLDTEDKETSSRLRSKFQDALATAGL